MQRRLLGLAAFLGLTASALSAQTPNTGEQKPGWYAGISGYASSLSNSSGALSVQGTDGMMPVEPVDPADCLLGVIPLLGPLLNALVGGLGVDQGCLLGLLGPGTAGSEGSPGVDPVEGRSAPAQLRFDSGFSVSAAIGYRTPGGFRPELAIDISDHDIRSASIAGESGNVSGDVSAFRLMSNAWFDINTGTAVSPYFGVGIGLQNTDLKLGNTKGDDSGFVYQIGAGIHYIVNPRTSVGLDYRYVVAQDPDFGLANRSNLSGEYSASNIGLGIRYLFAEAVELDSDGDGVPDRLDRCPNTPRGVVVDRFGCPVDSDGDGIPDFLDQCPNTPPGVQVDAQGCPIDTDGDGVPDYLDKCPGTPKGVAVDATGCPLDSDGDGVPDYLDRCPATAPGVAVGADGCPIAVIDSDGDGIPDNLDRCPDTPPGVPVDRFGCPLDSDGDGIPDYLDECPNTPPGLAVLPNGCALVADCRRPRPGEEVDARGCAVDASFILRGVKFEFDSATLTAEARRILDRVSETLKAYPNVNVELEGHTDSIGSASYNLGLSERRSIAVKDYLVSRGIPGSRMIPVGYGLSQPIADNSTEEGREENRRVELTVRQ